MIAMDGLATLQELRDCRLITEESYKVHVGVVLSRLDPALKPTKYVERRTTIAEAIHRAGKARIIATSPPDHPSPASAGSMDELSPELIADAAYLLITRRSGSAALLFEGLGLGTDQTLRVLKRLVELEVVSPAGRGLRRWPLSQPAQAEEVRARVRAACRHVPRAEPEDAVADTTPRPRPAGVPLELLTQAAELIVSSQFGSASMLQRKLKIGFATAIALMDALEFHGVVGPAAGGRPREVLVRALEVPTVMQRLSEAADDMQ